MGGGGGGSGTGVAQIDIIAELTPVSNAAGSVVGTVGILGAAGNSGASGVGHATTPSFDNTAFTITTRPRRSPVTRRREEHSHKHEKRHIHGADAAR